MSLEITEIEDIFKVSIENYKTTKAELNKLSKEVQKIYETDEDKLIVNDLEGLYDLEDEYFAKMIEATVLYSQIQTLYDRVGYVDSYRFIMNRISKEIEALEPIEAYFYFDYEEKKQETEKNDD